MENNVVKKGDRVKIIDGPGSGQHGEVFWTGANKWGPGLRLGVRGDDGETYWVSQDHTEPSTTAEPATEPGVSFEKGDRVAFSQRGQQGQGTVFWIGQSRGGGQRLGVHPDDSKEAVWLDARFARPAEAQAPPVAAEPQVAEVSDYAEFAPSLGPDELPPMAPLDDDYVEHMAQSIDEAQDEEPHDW